MKITKILKKFIASSDSTALSFAQKTAASAPQVFMTKLFLAKASLLSAVSTKIAITQNWTNNYKN